MNNDINNMLNPQLMKMLSGIDKGKLDQVTKMVNNMSKDDLNNLVRMLSKNSNSNGNENNT